MRTPEGQAEYLRRLQEGARIADSLPKRMGLQETAAALGISETAVRNIEYLALAKVARLIREHSITTLRASVDE